MSSKILGVQAFFPDSSACLVVDGKIVAAVQEERLTRQKRTRAFPHQSIDYCLKNQGLQLKDIDCVAFPINPAIYLEQHSAVQSNQLRYRGEAWYSIMSHLMSINPGQLASGEASQLVTLKDGSKINVQFIEHHLAHAAMAYYLSGVNRAAILSIDGFGEKDCILFAKANENKIEPFFKQEFPHSLGCFYLTITEFLGFMPNSDEWKVMGASSYGKPDTYYDQLLALFEFKEQGFELDLNYFNFYNFHRPLNYSSKLIELLGEPRKPGDPISERYFNIAAAAQKVTETVVFKLAQQLYQKTGIDHLCYSGGVAMNSVCNGKILDNTSFADIYIPFSPDDSGGSIGAALYAYHHIEQKPLVKKVTTNYLGPKFSDKETQDELDKFGLNYQLSTDIVRETAQLIAEGNIVGWFQGALEFGDRALGNRSILADPRRNEMKDVVNTKIKFREEFRPFAPSILTEYVNDYFEGAQTTNFMEKVYPIKERMRNEIPAVVHVDGTGRLQTVSKENNPLYYALIKDFHNRTGIPIVLNTSFNLKGEPIVCTVKDAVRTFYTCGMDILVVGNYVIKKIEVEVYDDLHHISSL